MPRFAANLSMLFTEHPFVERFDRAAAAGFEAFLTVDRGIEFQQHVAALPLGVVALRAEQRHRRPAAAPAGGARVTPDAARRHRGASPRLGLSNEPMNPTSDLRSAPATPAHYLVRSRVIGGR